MVRRTSLNTCLSKRKLKKTKFLGEDRFSVLPDHLLCRILSKLSIKDSVRTSVLSKRWNYLWLQVPVIDLDFHDFSNDVEFLECLDRFVLSYKELDLEKFKLVYDVNTHIQDDFVWRISNVVKRKVCHLTVVNQVDVQEDLVRMPLSLYSCGTLVNLTLYCVAMNDPMDIHRDNPGSESVSLPCLKTVYLEGVIFDDSSVLKTFISRCSALEDLTVVTHFDDFLKVVSVCSQSLKSFKLHSMRHEYDYEDEDPDAEIDDPDVEIDAPRLEYMSISGYQPKSFEILSVDPFAKLNVDVWFDVENDDDTMIRKFLIEISTFREMIISARSLECIHHYSKMEPVEVFPQFSNLSRLDASLVESSWEFLPTFLGCCINLRSLSVELDCLPEIEEIELSPVPQCVLSSLEFVKLKTTTVADTPRKRELVRCFLMKNCPVLKKMILCEP
ncbi:F-box protein [Cardamine amara subsp. amara]|uniref:F-box protein n=1 Tax=Cardamine amara subsp. amara TaxID=228776 RepID=A0ABD1BV59_CARAN